MNILVERNWGPASRRPFSFGALFSLRSRSAATLAGLRTLIQTEHGPDVTHLPNGTDLFLVIPVRQWDEETQR